MNVLTKLFSRGHSKPIVPKTTSTMDSRLALLNKYYSNETSKITNKVWESPNHTLTQKSHQELAALSAKKARLRDAIVAKYSINNSVSIK